MENWVAKIDAICDDCGAFGLMGESCARCEYAVAERCELRALAEGERPCSPMKADYKVRHHQSDKKLKRYLGEVRQQDGRFALVKRILDRHSDWYYESVRDCETGFLYREESHMLSVHRGRGSDREKIPYFSYLSARGLRSVTSFKNARGEIWATYAVWILPDGTRVEQVLKPERYSISPMEMDYMRLAAEQRTATYRCEECGAVADLLLGVPGNDAVQGLCRRHAGPERRALPNRNYSRLRTS